MAQNTKHRRSSLATPEPESIPTLKTHHLKPSSAAAANSGYPTGKNPHPSFPSKAQYFPGNVHRPDPAHKVRAPPSNPTNLRRNPPSASVDIRFQGKGLNLSADFDSRKHPKKPAHRAEKQRKSVEEPFDKMSKKFDDLKSKAGVEKEEEAVDIEKFDLLALGKEPRRQIDGGAELAVAGRRSSVSSSMAGGMMRRRSFCGLQVELGDVFASTGVKVVSVDMPPFMQIHAVDCARKSHDSLEKFSCRSLASTLKKEFDGVYGPAWHCIVGTSFGSFVTHSVGGFMYFSMDHKMYILLFKTSVTVIVIGAGLFHPLELFGIIHSKKGSNKCNTFARRVYGKGLEDGLDWSKKRSTVLWLLAVEGPPSITFFWMGHS